GKYADTETSREVTAEHVRAAAQSVYPVMRTDYAQHLNLHEKLLLLGLARTLERTQETYASMGETEIAYKMACEEYKEPYRAHTQVWKYVQNLGATGIVSTQPPPCRSIEHCDREITRLRTSPNVQAEPR